MNQTPEEALAKVRALLADINPKAKPEYVWSVVHHEYGTWLHLDVFDLSKNPQNPNIAPGAKKDRKYSRQERYRFCAVMSLPVCEVDTLIKGVAMIGEHPAGRCKNCTQLWRSLNGYGSEDDIDNINDLPGYQRAEQMR
jgi:hypothetical protein